MSIEDRAQEIELAQWERNNQPRERLIFNPDDEGYGPEQCVNCDDDMHEVRRAYGFKVCVVCATEFERLKSRGLF